MGFGNIGIWQLLIILLIVVVIFGTKKLRNMGGDVGGAVKNFREAMTDEEKKQASGALGDQSTAGTTQGEINTKAPSDKNSTE